MINQFAFRHLIKKEPLPKNLDQKSTTNTTLYNASMANEHYKNIIQIAGRGRKCVTADYNGTNNENASTLIFGHFAPGGMKADKKGYGILSTHQTGIDPENTNREKEICYNGPPTNGSVWTVYNNIAKVISNRYGLGLKEAQVCSMELCAWVDIVPVVMPHDAADPNSDYYREYLAMREKMDPHSMKYIQYVIEEVLKNVKNIIAVGNHAFEFVEKMIKDGMIDSEKVKFFQHSPIAHPTKQFKFGLSIKQRHWVYQTITDMLTHILEQDPVRISSEEVMVLSEIRTNNNNNTRDNFIYYGYYKEKKILIARSHGHCVKLLRDAYVSSATFQTHGTLLESEERIGDVDGLRVELVWYTDFDDGLQFGYQYDLESEIMKEWIKAAIENQKERLIREAKKKRTEERNIAGEAIQAGLPGFDALLEKYKEDKKSAEK